MRGVGAQKQRFLLTLIGALLLSLGTVALFNAAVDPYGLIGSPRVAGFNAIKPRPGAWIGEIKLASARRLRPEAVIVGNSRAEIGFDPQSDSLSRRKALTYNLAVPGAPLGSNIALLSELAGDHQPRLVIVGLDFLDFLAAGEPAMPTGSLTARWPRPNHALLILKALFTAQATRDAFDTLRIQHMRNPASLTELGFNPLSDYRAIVQREGYYVLFRQRAEESARSLHRKSLRLRGSPDRLDGWQLESLRALLKDARRWRSEVHLVIYPYHAELLMLLDGFGLWPAFDDFKRAVTAEVARAQSDGTAAVLWDFSGASPYATEPIPERGDRRTHAQWYWEAGHFKRELGDLILARVLGQPKVWVDTSFGVRLDAKMLEGHLRAQRDELERLEVTYPALSAEVTALIAASRRQ